VATQRGVPLLGSGVCQDEGALCLRFRNHPGLMSMTETPINSEIREKPHRFVLPRAWGWTVARVLCSRALERKSIRYCRCIVVDSPGPWGGDGVLRSMPAGPMSRIVAIHAIAN
jgi:hypothetical protein